MVDPKIELVIRLTRIIGIVSGKGGVGKTTLVANLGAAFTQFNRSVTLVDCNVTTSHLGFCFGIFYYPKTLNQVLNGKISLSEATYALSSNLKLIPASLSIEDLVGIDLTELKFSIQKIDDDLVLLDSAPGFGREAMSVLKASHEIIFVTTPFLNAVSDVIRGYKIARHLGLKVSGIILNMVRKEPHELSQSDVEGLTGLPVIGIVPFDINVQRSLAAGVPLVYSRKYSPASISFMRIAANLLGEAYTPPRFKIFSRIYDYLRAAFSLKQKAFEAEVQ